MSNASSIMTTVTACRDSFELTQRQVVQTWN